MTSEQALEGLAVDACTGINVAATGRWAAVFLASKFRPVMARPAADEVQSLLNEDGEREAVDLGELANQDLVEISELTEAELETMLIHVVRLGHGEAATLAMAVEERMPMATDDRAAQRAAGDLDPPLTVITTPQLLHTWYDEMNVSAALCGEVVRRVETRARYRPRGDDVDVEWWEKHRA
jgi:hypothetical protein